AHACRSWRLRRRAARPRSLLGGIPASRRSLTLAALGAYGAGPLGPAHCSAGYPPPDARSREPRIVERQRVSGADARDGRTGSHEGDAAAPVERALVVSDSPFSVDEDLQLCVGLRSPGVVR